MYRGLNADYYWLEIVDSTKEWKFMDDLLRICPEFVRGKYLVITAWDSGPLKLRGENFRSGWIKHDRLAINPAVQSVNDVPYMSYDEWYIFSKTPLLEPFKVFVNDFSFSLRDPEDLLSEKEPIEVERIKELQELFWLQIELKRVETYVSAGHRFLLVTQEKELYQRMVDFLCNDNN